MSDSVSTLEKRIDELLMARAGTARHPRRYASDGFAQGVLLHHLEGHGLHHEELPELPLFGAAAETALYGSRFRGAASSFEAYAPSPGEALARAACKALASVAQRRLAG